IIASARRDIVGQALRLPCSDPPGRVALQLKNAHNLLVSEFQFGGEFVWYPTPELIAQSNLQHFIEKHGLGSYDELMRKSITDIAWFWNTVLCDLSIQFYKPYSRVVDLSEGKPWA